MTKEPERGPARSVRVLLILLWIGLAPVVMAADMAVVPEDSLFAVITHKGGFAAGKAHNHLIAAEEFRASLTFDAGAPEQTTFTLTVPVDRLTVDRPDLRERWYPRLKALGLLEEPFGALKDKTRSKIRDAMLGPKQLDVGNHPTITVRLEQVTAEATTLGNTVFPHAVTIAFTLHGQVVTVPAAVRYTLEGDALTIEGVGTARFTNFGIKPFSAFMGAVKNLDEFHLYLNLRAIQGVSARRPQDKLTEN